MDVFEDKQADECGYSDVLDGQRMGVVPMPDPQSFRRSWYHARDYGLLVANPFGGNAFIKDAKSQVMVARGEEFRLPFGVLIYRVPEGESPDTHAVYKAIRRTNAVAVGDTDKIGRRTP